MIMMIANCCDVFYKLFQRFKGYGSIKQVSCLLDGPGSKRWTVVSGADGKERKYKQKYERLQRCESTTGAKAQNNVVWNRERTRQHKWNGAKKHKYETMKVDA